MGVELKWDVDAAGDQTQPGDVGGQGRGRPWRGLVRLVFFLVVAALFAAGVHLRLREVDSRQEDLLRASVEAEITALRLGDMQAFERLQYGSDAARQMGWRESFDAWQLRKTTSDARGGGIAALAIRGENAWVRVEEIIGAETWLHTWFYRRSGDGWRHLSAQSGWRGNARSYRSEGLRVDYDDMDAPLVDALAPLLESWRETGCQLLDYGRCPDLGVQVTAQPGAAAWSTADSWHLLLPSPWAGPAPLGDALTPELRSATARLLAERLLRETAGQPGADWTREARWMHASAGAWLAGRMLREDRGQFLLRSLAEQHGDQAVTALTGQLGPASTLDLIAAVTGVADLREAALDWRDLLLWQLEQEAAVRLAGDGEGFLDFYDLRDAALGVPARARLAAGEFNGPLAVDATAPFRTAEGEALLRAEVRDAGGTTTVFFRLVDGRWLRAS